MKGEGRRIPAEWNDPLSVLREKWKEVPAAGSTRVMSARLLEMDGAELVRFWESQRKADTTGRRFAVRGWYHTLYADILEDREVMDVGCGMGIDGITFAQHGARVTFVDVVESNLQVVERLCRAYDLHDVGFCYMDEFGALSQLGHNYDAIWCQGSMINAPFEIACEEAKEILAHLRVGGRWIELAYPRIRWEREGRLPFSQWGKLTDGEGTPWVEWYDLDKMMKRLEPARFDVVLCFEFYDGKFNWFDLLRSA